MCTPTSANQRGGVFISYSRWNKYFALQLDADLTRMGWQPWLDQRSIEIGTEWEARIQAGVQSSEYILLLWSPEAEKSDFVQREFEMASIQLANQKLGIARIAGQEADMPVAKSKYQHIDATDEYENSLTRISSWLAGERIDVEHPRERLVFGDSIGAIRSNLRAAGADPISVQITDRSRAAGQQRREFFYIPIDASGYSSAYYLGEERAIAQECKDLAVSLKFSADPSRDTVDEVLRYLASTGTGDQAIVFKGPRHEKEFNLPDEKSAVWADAVRLMVRVLRRYAVGKTLHFFMDAPGALAFSVALEFGKFSPMRIYNLNRTGIGADRYTQVFSNGG